MTLQSACERRGRKRSAANNRTPGLHAKHLGTRRHATWIHNVFRPASHAAGGPLLTRAAGALAGNPADSLRPRP